MLRWLKRRWCHIWGCEEQACPLFAPPPARAMFCFRCKTLRLIDVNGVMGQPFEFEMAWNEDARGNVQRLPRIIIRRAFTLLELLIVMAVIGICLALLLSAVQKVREAAARTQCQNHLHQIGLALHSFHDAYSQFPTGGTVWSDPPTYSANGPTLPPTQNAGWAFQVLPFIDQENLQRDEARVVSTPVPMYFCPARRAPVVIGGHALIDYASATGTNGGATQTGPYYGVIARNPNRVAITDVTDGLSNTLVIGEKRLNPAQYYTGCWYDDEGFTDGWDNDIVCITTLGLAQDGGTPAYMFGAAHPTGMNAVFGDGSVRQVAYSLSASVLTAVGDRRDGSVFGD